MHHIMQNFPSKKFGASEGLFDDTTSIARTWTVEYEVRRRPTDLGESA